jgi:hypothetical protein
VTFLHYAVVGHFSPALESVEFTSKENCEHARTAYLAELAPLAAHLNDAIRDELKNGLIKPPNGVIISAICVAK